MSLPLILLALTADAAPPPAAGPTVRHDIPVHWSADGTHVVVGNTVVDVATGGTRHLPADWRYSALSPDGKASARVHEEILHVHREGRPFQVPVGDAVVSWLDPTTLLVVQRAPDWVFTCGTVRLDAPTVTSVPCPTSEYHQLYGVVPGPDGVLAVLSSGEGHPGVNLVRWSPEAQSPVEIPRLDLYPYGPMTVGFGRGRVWLYTSCDLRKARGCTLDENPPHYVFQFRLGETSATLHREGLPSGLSYDPIHDRFAWVEGQRWCIGDLRSTPTCHALDDLRARSGR